MTLNITKEDLMPLIEECLSQREIAERLGCSQTSVRYYLTRLGLKTSRAISNKKHKCGSCGESDSEKFYKGKKTACKKCMSTVNLLRLKNNRKRVVSYLGGKCIVCGYARCAGALAVHHLDPTTKDPRFFGSHTWAWERMEKELRTCVLLCANCHAEVHHGGLDLAPFI